MVARFASAGLGLLAFAVTITAGLLAHNPVTVTLSRSIFALFAFCIVGFVLGGVASRVIAEHEEERKAEIRKRYREKSTDKDEGQSRNESGEERTHPDETEELARRGAASV